MLLDNSAARRGLLAASFSSKPASWVLQHGTRGSAI
eukprot:CAMPEP_0116966734 /NCGR_PEP_ID=MMETSP0467-20121206/50060_1 /TAXON_ID=283647 /ORGANISM="Mesodinium pulex, Strain SPMC105" /LENGTH=35 /DNA_ID= /DNA_START= /DNA_END= /DNA_ORIENTATION=